MPDTDTLQIAKLEWMLGDLTTQMVALRVEVAKARTEVQEARTEVQEMKQKFRLGKSIGIAVLITIGAFLFGIKDLIVRAWEGLT